MPKAKRRPGRPSLGVTAMSEPIMVRFPAEMIEALDALCESRLDAPARSVVIRELVADALQSKKKRK